LVATGTLPVMGETAKRQYDLALEELGNGRPAAAVSALRQALALEESFAPAHYALGLALRDLQRLPEAQKSFARALEMDPSANQSRIELADILAELGQLEPAAAYYKEAIGAGVTGLHMRLGAVLWKMGDAAAARDAFAQGIAGGVSSAEANYNLGSAQLELGQFGEAEKSARAALRGRAGFAQARMLCAAALVAQGKDEAAFQVVQQPLAIGMRLMSSKLFEPARRCLEKVAGDPQARHLLAAMSGQNPERPVAGYVRQLFDASAPTFDREVAGKLGYAIPREMVDALLRVGRGPWDVLDLGCGTGLVGAAIAAHSRRLVGVDLAPNMIQAAQKRGVYTELHCADITEAMNGSFDVIAAADVFIYVGKLDGVVPAIRKALKPGGLFAFSVELAGNGQDYKLGVMGRYAHSAAYLSRLASGFERVECRETTLRLEHRKPVKGLLNIWRAKDGNA
jgi:predicted TPR repeat methyltransferase